jgi:hypothetical protein
MSPSEAGHFGFWFLRRATGHYRDVTKFNQREGLQRNYGYASDGLDFIQCSLAEVPLTKSDTGDRTRVQETPEKWRGRSEAGGVKLPMPLRTDRCCPTPFIAKADRQRVGGCGIPHDVCKVRSS